MKIVLKAEDPDTIQMTMRITISLGEWKRISEALSNGTNVFTGSAVRLSNTIKYVVIKASSEFYEEQTRDI